MTSSLALFSRLSLHHSGIQLPTCKMDKNLLNVVTVKLNRTVNVKIPSLGLTNNQLSTDKLSGWHELTHFIFFQNHSMRWELLRSAPWFFRVENEAQGSCITCPASENPLLRDPRFGPRESVQRRCIYSSHSMPTLGLSTCSFFFLADEWVQLIKAACWVKVCIRVEAVNTALCSLSSPMPHLHPLLPRSSYKAPGSSRQQHLTKAEQSRLAPVGIWWMKERHEKAKAPKGWETCVNVLSRFCRVWLFATSWTIACQAPNLAWIKTVGGGIRPQVCLVQSLGRVSVQSPCMPTRLRMTDVAVVLTRSDFAGRFF